jgi:hypothetical protein
MNILKSKPVSQAPFIRTESQWAIPGHRKTRNKRFAADNRFLGYSKPLPVVDPQEAKRVREAQQKGAKLGAPADNQIPDISRYTPMPHHLIVKRGPPIKVVDGVTLPEDKWRHEKHFYVVRVGPDVTACQPGDRVLFGRGVRTKEFFLGTAKFYVAREEAVVGLVETPL